MKSDLQIMHQMVSENKDIRLSTTLVETKTVKQGGVVIMGVDTKTLQDITLPELLGKGKYFVGLYVVNIEQFNEIKKQPALSPDDFFAAAFFKWTQEEGKDLVKSLTMTGPMLVEAYKEFLTKKS